MRNVFPFVVLYHDPPGCSPEGRHKDCGGKTVMLQSKAEGQVLFTCCMYIVVNCKSLLHFIKSRQNCLGLNCLTPSPPGCEMSNNKSLLNLVKIV